MKSYTDIEQSKKLAEILPLESADMALCAKTQPLMTNYTLAKKKFSNAGEIPIDPCWSLAALLDVLPSSTIDSSNDHHYRLHCMERFTEWHDNPVDSCVEVIIKLHKEGLL